MTTETVGGFADDDLRVEMVDCAPPEQEPQALPTSPETSQAQQKAQATIESTGADPPPEGLQ